MRRIDTATVAEDLFGPGKHGFRDGDPATAVLATRLNAAHFNAVQEEIAGVIEGAGEALDPANNGQLFNAIKLLFRSAGQVSAFAMSTPPAGWLKANGALVSRTTYADLFAAIGTTFGVGDGATTFGLPDLRGEFLRVWDDGRGVDAGRALGSGQADEIKSHDHSYTQTTVAVTVATGSGVQVHRNPAPGSTGATGGAETRPRNIALLACIKY